MCKTTLILGALFWTLSAYPAAISHTETLRIVDFNVWHGLGSGSIKLREYETPEQREARYQRLVEALLALQPDIVALQEANLLPAYARRTARDLGYDEIHQVANGGIKIGGLGIPTNIKEGLVILAKKEFNLERVGARRLSGPWYSIQNDFISFQLAENRYALAGKVTVRGKTLYLFNVHLHAGSEFPNEKSYFVDLLALRERNEISEEEYRKKLDEVKSHTERRRKEIFSILDFIAQATQGENPVILLGDFNATEASEEIQVVLEQGGLLDSFRVANPESPGYTWDTVENPNTRRDDLTEQSGEGEKNPVELLEAQYEAVPRRIDYIFLSRHFAEEEIVNSRVIFDRVDGGIYTSDHFGVLTEIAF
ncbi:MAG: endonuclease/exonuclease/phosphatase family protein [Candidatus Bipolaricaulia bacterium]